MSTEIKILDPVYFQNKSRAEFRLNDLDTAYLTSGMYLSLGTFGTNATRGEVHYNRRAGIASAVKSIRLLDGGNVLAQLDNAGSWMAWKGCNHDNSDLLSKKQMRMNSAALMHFGMNKDNFFTQTVADSQNGVPLGSLGTTEGTPTTDPSVGYLPVKEFLHELEVLRALPTPIFQNLRLVVNFTTEVTTILKELSSGAGVVSGLAQIRPILVVETVSDPEIISAMVSEMRQMSFTGIESDLFTVPATEAYVAPPNNPRQVTNQQIRGFNNKIVNRMLMVTQPTDTSFGNGIVASTVASTGSLSAVVDSGKLNSLAQNRLTIQCRINGSNLFQGRGIGYDDSYKRGNAVVRLNGAGYNHRLAMVTDTWGDVAICQGGNTTGLVANLINDVTDDADLKLTLVNGQQELFYGSDYTAWRVQDRVSHLEIGLGRSPCQPKGTEPFMFSSAPNQSLNVICYAEIPKTLQIAGDGTYRVAYL